MKVHTVLACVFGLGFSYPDTTGGFVSRPGGVGLGGVGLRAGLRSAPVTVSRTPALISVPQSGVRVVSPPLGGGVVSRPLHAGPVVSPLPLRTNVVTGPAVVTSGPVGVLGSRPLPALATGVAGPAVVSSGPIVSTGPVVHAAQHNVGAPVAATTKVHHSSHNEVAHHGEHGGSEGGYGYDEKPDPFHFEYGVHDDHYYTDFSESREGDEYGNIVGEYQVALPDGRIQYVKYTADGNYGGTIMEVSYKGEARHPETHHVEHSPSVHHDAHGASPVSSPIF